MSTSTKQKTNTSKKSITTYQWNLIKLLIYQGNNLIF